MCGTIGDNMSTIASSASPMTARSLLTVPRKLHNAIQQFHLRRDRRIERVAPADVIADLLDGVVHGPPQLSLRLAQSALFGGACRTTGGKAGNRTPHLLQETRGALHAVIRPFERLLRRCGEHREQAHCIGPEPIDQILRINRVAFRLRHLGAIFEHHTLGQQLAERLRRVNQPSSRMIL